MLVSTPEVHDSLNTGNAGPHCTTAAQIYECTWCNTSFKRSEHLKRHLTQHNKSKAFSCQYCSKAFSRSDVLSRHYSSCRAAKASGHRSDPLGARKSSACKPCRDSKVKCRCSNDPSICDRCQNLGSPHLCIAPPRADRNRIVSTGERIAPISGSQSVMTHQSERELSEPLASASENIPEPVQEIEPVNIELDSRLDVEPGIAEFNVELDAPIVSIGVESGIFNASTDPQDMLGVIAGSATDTYFNVDVLDYSLLESVFQSQAIDQSVGYTSESWDMDHQTVSYDMAQMLGDEDLDMLNQHQSESLPTGLTLMQFSPLESHRNEILQYLRDTKECGREQLGWLSLDNMNLFIWSYFTHCHQHTPLLHLPSWNIGTASTRLIFAMVLMGAMYSGDLADHGKRSRKLCELAERYAWATDPLYTSKGGVTLDTIQAVYLLALLDGFYFSSSRHRPKVDLKRLLTAARSAGLFDRDTYIHDHQETSWQDWAVNQSRLRTAFILYLYGVIRAIFFGERSELHLYELRISLPCHESTFAAADEETWRRNWEQSSDLTKLDYPVVLSAVLSPKALDCSLSLSVMGSFILLHGILYSVWEERQLSLREEMQSLNHSSDRALVGHLAETCKQTTTNALAFWIEHWNKTLSNPLTSESSGLYRDRAVLYWFLCHLWNRQDAVDSNGVTYHKGPETNSWTMKIPRLMKKMTILLDQDPTQQVLDVAMSFWSMEDDEGSAEDSCDGDTMDTISVNFLLRRNQAQRSRQL